MTEPLKVILSAWSVAFIVLFLFWLLFAFPTNPNHVLIWVYALLFLFCGAVTGVGWLWYRSEEKEEKAASEEPKL